MASNEDQPTDWSGYQAHVPKQPVPLATLVGRRVREAREAAGLRQDDVAAAAGGMGLKWGRSSVAALEAGNRKLAAEELLLLPFVLDLAGAGVIDLIRDDDRIMMSPTMAVWGKNARTALLGQEGHAALIEYNRAQRRKLNERFAGPVDIPAFYSNPKERLNRAQFLMIRYEHALRALALWPQLTEDDALAALSDRRSESVRKVAGNVQAPPEAVAFMARALWGRTLTEERDIRAEERKGGSDARALQGARGYVTRELTDELRSEWESETPDWFQGRTKHEQWALDQLHFLALQENDAGELERRFMAGVERATKARGVPLSRIREDIQAFLDPPEDN